MKTENIEECIKYTRLSVTGRNKWLMNFVLDATAELAILKEENERLRGLLGEWRKLSPDENIRIEARSFTDLSFRTSLAEKTDAALSQEKP